MRKRELLALPAVRWKILLDYVGLLLSAGVLALIVTLAFTPVFRWIIAAGVIYRAYATIRDMRLRRWSEITWSNAVDDDPFELWLAGQVSKLAIEAGITIPETRLLMTSDIARTGGIGPSAMIELDASIMADNLWMARPVIAHEVGHIVIGDIPRAAIRWSFSVSAVTASLVALAFSLVSLVSGSFAAVAVTSPLMAMTVGFLGPFVYALVAWAIMPPSFRAGEYAADAIGAALVGPEEMIRLLNAMESDEVMLTSEGFFVLRREQNWIDTHPPAAQRIDAIRKDFGLP